MAEYVILYTHQKQKKAKTWKDGILKVLTTGRKGSIYDDKNNKIDTVFLKNPQVSVGDEIESDRYLIQIESVRLEHQDTTRDSAQKSQVLGRVCSSRQPSVVQTCTAGAKDVTVKQAPRFVGLKRKNTGFNPPRQVRPKVEETLKVKDNLNQAEATLSHRRQKSFQTPGHLSNITTTPQSLGDSVHGIISNPTDNVNEFLHVRKQEQSLQNDLSSPWSIVGKSKIKRFHSPSSNSQTDSQISEDDYLDKKQVVRDDASSSGIVGKVAVTQSCHDVDVKHTTQVDLDSERFKSGNNSVYKVPEKRSTSQILALIGDKRRTVGGDLKESGEGATMANHTSLYSVGAQRFTPDSICCEDQKKRTVGGNLNRFSEDSTTSNSISRACCDTQRLKTDHVSSISKEGYLSGKEGVLVSTSSKHCIGQQTVNIPVLPEDDGMYSKRSQCTVKASTEAGNTGEIDVGCSDVTQSYNVQSCDNNIANNCELVCRLSPVMVSNTVTESQGYVDKSIPCLDVDTSNNLGHSSYSEVSNNTSPPQSDDKEVAEIPEIVVSHKLSTDCKMKIRNVSNCLEQDGCGTIRTTMECFDKMHQSEDSETVHKSYRTTESFEKMDHSEGSSESIDVCDNILDKFWEKNNLLMSSESQESGSGSKAGNAEIDEQSARVDKEVKSDIGVIKKKSCDDEGDSKDGGSNLVSDWLPQTTGGDEESKGLTVNTYTETACFDMNFSPFSDASLSDYETVACVENKVEDDVLSTGFTMVTEKMICNQDLDDRVVCNQEKSVGSQEGEDNNVAASCAKVTVKSNTEEFSNYSFVDGREKIVTCDSRKENCDDSDRNVCTKNKNDRLDTDGKKDGNLKENECTSKVMDTQENASGVVEKFKKDHNSSENACGFGETRLQMSHVKHIKSDSEHLAVTGNLSNAENDKITPPVNHVKMEDVSTKHCTNLGTDNCGLIQGSSRLFQGDLCNNGQSKNTVVKTMLSSSTVLGSEVTQSVDQKFLLLKPEVYSEQLEQGLSTNEQSEQGLCTNSEEKAIFRLSGLNMSPDDPDFGMKSMDLFPQESGGGKVFTGFENHQGSGSRSGFCAMTSSKSKAWKGDEGIEDDGIKYKQESCVSTSQNVRTSDKRSDLYCGDTCVSNNSLKVCESVKADNVNSKSFLCCTSADGSGKMLTDGASNILVNSVKKGINAMATSSVMTSGGNVVAALMSDSVKKPGFTQTSSNWDDASDNWRSQTDSCRTSDTMCTYTSGTESEESSQATGILGNEGKLGAHLRSHDSKEYHSDGVSVHSLQQSTHHKYTTAPRHGLLPHPEELMGKTLHRNSTETCYQGGEPVRDPLQMAKERLCNYSVKGSVSSCTVRRQSTGNSDTLCDQTGPESGFYLDKSTRRGHTDTERADMEAPHTPDVECSAADLTENSLYHSNTEENIKKRFSHENLFIVTPRDVFKQSHTQKASRMQCVPETFDLDIVDRPHLQEKTFDSKLRHPRIREPVKSQPFEDDMRQVSYTEQVSQFSARDDRKLESFTMPEQKKVPVWMEQSPGDLSFTLSPFPSFTDHHHHNNMKPPRSTCINLVGLDCDSQETEEQNIDEPPSDLMDHKVASHNKHQTVVHHSTAGRFTTQSLRQLKTTDLNNESNRDESNHTLGNMESRWNRFSNLSQDENIKQHVLQDNLVSVSSQKNSYTSVSNPTVNNSFRKGRKFSQSADALCTSAHVPVLSAKVPLIRTGVDHLVSSSPAITTEIELTSDISTDNDSQCLTDFYFDIDTPQKLLETPGGSFGGQMKTDQMCPEFGHSVSSNRKDRRVSGNRVSPSVTEEFKGINQRLYGKKTGLGGEGNQMAEFRLSPVPCASTNVIGSVNNMYRQSDIVKNKSFQKHSKVPNNSLPSVGEGREDPFESRSPTLQTVVGGSVVGLQQGFQPPRPSGGHGNHRAPEECRSFSVPASNVTGNSVVPSSQRNLCGDLHFPSKSEAESNISPCRQITIPTSFSSVSVYKQVLKQALQEHLNVQLFDLSKRYHTALSRLDLTDYTPLNTGTNRGSSGPSVSSQSNNPPCEHNQPSKIVQVKKEGPNKGRFFFACSNTRTNQCKFFKWADETGSGKNTTMGTGLTEGGRGSTGLCLTDGASIGTFFKGQGLRVYCESVFLRKVPDSYRSHQRNAPAWVKKRKFQDTENTVRKKVYIGLSRKDSSSLFTKDDLWVISQQLTFDPGCTFVARSVFYGPSTSNEVEIEPLTGYCPSNWQTETTCHTIHVGNACSELMCLTTLQDFVKPTCLPVLPALLSMDNRDIGGSLHLPRGKSMYYGPWENIVELADQLIREHGLNQFQCEALLKVVSMFEGEGQGSRSAVTLIHGVFGAGKSFLLAVIVKLIVKISELRDLYTPGVPEPCKVLISSTTNVAVDRILLGLLDMDFDQFVRVGSVKKIAKAILPYSMHATGTDSQEMRDLQEMLKSDISPSERGHVRKRIDQLRRGENRRQLDQVRVVGATCAACPFPSLKGLCFSVVILDECSQITEPASLLPIARFGCEKLILVGDPKQLDPTIEGSEAAHRQGLEQTLFDRLIHMGHKPTMLRIQYRCHPMISAIANQLFYGGELYDGVREEDRPPLRTDLPTLCFYDVTDGCEVCEKGGSFCNLAEAEFVATLIESLVTGGVEPSDIGVITLYKAQQEKIGHLLRESSVADLPELKAIQISTVDAFQGGERNVIILSCVRTHSSGFIDNDKRTNVALTRSRHHLLIVGNRRNLNTNKLWAKVLKHCSDSCAGMSTAELFRKKFGDRSDNFGPFVPSTSPISDYTGCSKEMSAITVLPIHCDHEDFDSVVYPGGDHVPTAVDSTRQLQVSTTTTQSHTTDKAGQRRKRKFPLITDNIFSDSGKENSSDDGEELPIGL